MTILAVKLPVYRPLGVVFTLALEVTDSVITLTCNNVPWSCDPASLPLWEGTCLSSVEGTLTSIPFSGRIPAENALPLLSVWNIGDAVLVGIYVGVGDTLTSQIPVAEAPSLKSFANTFPQRAEYQAIQDIKEDTIYCKLVAYSSIATLEAQVDFLTKILIDIVSKDPALQDTYKDALQGIYAVGNFGQQNTPATIQAEKATIRAIQQDYFTERDNLRKNNG